MLARLRWWTSRWRTWSTGGRGTPRMSTRRPGLSPRLKAGEAGGGEIASDLYGPQFWDDNFQFSFSVVVSCKSNKQLGYF